MGMRYLDFTKMAGAGNDFIVLDNRRGRLKGGLAGWARRLCSRKRSVGADGLLFFERSKKADCRMRIFNPDGSQARMCGNGVRCIARFAVARGIAKSRLTVETPAGIIEARVDGDDVRAGMVPPSGLRLGFKLSVNGRSENLNFVNTGVPHAVVFEDSLRDCDVLGRGRAIRRHPHFAPKGTNVNFVVVRGRSEIDVRTYERGVEDNTLSCGTGSTASALVASALENLKSPVRVHTLSGEVLKVYFSRSGAGDFEKVYLEGPVETIFEGRIRL